MRTVSCLAACLAAAAVLAGQAGAQMSVTTIGATDAVSCYNNAQDDFSKDTDACDKALADGRMNQTDRKKTLVNRGVIRNRAGALAEAKADFNAALAIDEALGEAYLNRGNSHYLERQFNAALADYQRALEAGVNKPWAAWYNIGLVYQAQNKQDEARAAFEKALELNPDFSQAKQKLER